MSDTVALEVTSAFNYGSIELIYFKHVKGWEID